MSTASAPGLGHADRAVVVTLVLAAAAWALLLAGAVLGGESIVSHHAVLEGDHALAPAVGAFAVGWAVMVGAMMLPSTVPVVGAYARLTADRPGRQRALAAFLAAYTAVWMGFGLAALAGDAGLHALVHRAAWLEQHPSVIPAGIFVAAGVAQLLPVTRRCLDECRDPVRLLTRDGGATVDGGAWATGVRHGVACLGATGALMLVMFAVGLHHVLWVAALTAVLVAEKTMRGGQRLLPVVGVALVATGVGVAVT